MSDRLGVLPSPAITFLVRQAMRCSPIHAVDTRTPPTIEALLFRLDAAATGLR